MKNHIPAQERPSPESLQLHARRLQAEAIKLGLRLAGQMIKRVAAEIVDAHRRRALMLQLASMDDARLKDIGVLRGGIEDFVTALDQDLLARRTANDPAVTDRHVA